MKLEGRDKIEVLHEFDKSMESLVDTVCVTGLSQYRTAGNSSLREIHEIFTEILEILGEARYKLCRVEDYL